MTWEYRIIPYEITLSDRHADARIGWVDRSLKADGNLGKTSDVSPR